jgi:hypothetical protein
VTALLGLEFTSGGFAVLRPWADDAAVVNCEAGRRSLGSVATEFTRDFSAAQSAGNRRIRQACMLPRENRRWRNFLNYEGSGKKLYLVVISIKYISIKQWRSLAPRSRKRLRRLFYLGVYSKFVPSLCTGLQPSLDSHIIINSHQASSRIAFNLLSVFSNQFTTRVYQA